MLRTIVLTAALAGCGWNHLPGGSSARFDGPLWDPLGVVAVTDGLYVPLPHTGQVAYIEVNGDITLMPLRPAVVTSLVAAPDRERGVAFLTSYPCPDSDPTDCPSDAREARTEIALLRAGAVEQAVEVPGAYNSVAFSHDGSWAIAWIDLSKEVEVGGVVSLSTVVVLDLATGTAHPVGVGFAADQVLFSDDDARAVVLSRSEVAVIDLLASPPVRQVTFPLVLDPDDVVVPVGVALTPDGRHAMISAQGSSDLYVLDLENPSVNLVSLAGAPTAMAVDAATDQTVFTFAGQARVDVLEHTYFEAASLPLDEPMHRILLEDGMALLWNDAGGHDAYRLDLATLGLVEYRLENPAVQLHLAPTHEFALALTRPEGGAAGGAGGLYDQSPGMQILDLRTDRGTSVPYLLEGQGIGAAFIATDTDLSALVLQRDVRTLYALDLYTNDVSALDLADRPLAIGTVPDGPFYITHDNGLGLVSFYDPATGALREVSGFATLGILDGRPARTESAP